MKLKMQREWGDFKAGDIVEVAEEQAKDLIKYGIAVEYDEKAAKDETERAERLQKAVRDAVSDAVKSIKKDSIGINIEVRENVPEEPQGFKSLGEQLKAVSVAATTGNFDPRLGKAALGGNEAVDADGGFLVQSTFLPELQKQMFENAMLVNRCQVTEVAGDRLEWNELDNYNRTDGNRPVSMQWMKEAGTYASSKPTLLPRELKVEKLGGLYYATEELLEDTTALESEVSSWFAEEGSVILDDVLLNGNGVGKPLGILNAPCLVTQAKEAAQDADTVNAANVSKMLSRMPAGYLSGAEWFINSDVLPQLMQLTIGDQPIWMPPNGYIGGPAGLLLGRPLNFCEHCAALGDVGDIILGNWSQYKIVRKSGGMKMATSVHVQFLTGEVAFRFSIRVNGAPKPSKVITPAKGSTKSPFVALAAR